MKQESTGPHGLTIVALICTLFALVVAFEPVNARSLPMVLMWQVFCAALSLMCLWARTQEAP